MFDCIYGNFQSPISLSIVELLVDMDCQKCEKKVRRAISKLYGVNRVEIDMNRQKVTVTGYVNRDEVLKMVKRTRRRVEIWPYGYNNGYNGDYCYTQSSSMNGYYLRPSQRVQTTTIDENDLYLFSDDNVSACCIM